MTATVKNVAGIFRKCKYPDCKSYGLEGLIKDLKAILTGPNSKVTVFEPNSDGKIFKCSTKLSTPEEDEHDYPRRHTYTVWVERDKRYNYYIKIRFKGAMIKDGWNGDYRSSDVGFFPMRRESGPAIEEFAYENGYKKYRECCSHRLWKKTDYDKSKREDIRAQNYKDPYGNRYEYKDCTYYLCVTCGKEYHWKTLSEGGYFFIERPTDFWQRKTTVDHYSPKPFQMPPMPTASSSGPASIVMVTIS